MLFMPLLSGWYQKPQIKGKGVLLMALDKIVTIEVLEGGPLPAHRIEVLKDLLRKVALRKLVKMREEFESEKVIIEAN
jgi:hypothetical protein